MISWIFFDAHCQVAGMALFLLANVSRLPRLLADIFNFVLISRGILIRIRILLYITGFLGCTFIHDGCCVLIAIKN